MTDSVSRVKFFFGVASLGLASLLLAANSLTAQVRVTTSLDTSRGYVGDIFHYTIDIQHPHNNIIEYPDTVHQIGSLTVRDISKEQSESGTRVTYALTAYDTGAYTIPPVPFKVRPPDTSGRPLRFHSASEQIAIVSLVPPDAKDLRDIKPLMDIPGSFPWTWVGLGVLIIAGAFGGYNWWKHHREEEVELSPQERRLSAHVNAYKRLREIEKARYAEQGAMKDHFSEVSETIREYFEHRYFFPALEMTTSETLRELAGNRLHKSTLERTESVLNLSDLVKFAKHTPTLDEADETLKKAYIIVDDTKIEPQRTQENGSVELTATNINDEHKPLETKGEST